MVGLASLKMIDEVDVEVPERFRPVKAFAGGLATSAAGIGVSADPTNGRLTLSPGVYLLAMAMNVAFAHAHAPAVTLALVLGVDPRFKGPRQTVCKKSGGNVSIWGVVTVPPGEPAVCELWAAVVDDQYPTKVRIAAGEMLAVLLQTPGVSP